MQKTEIYITTYDQGYPVTDILDDRCKKLCEFDGAVHLVLDGMNREFRLSDDGYLTKLSLVQETNILSENGLVRRIYFTK